MGLNIVLALAGLGLLTVAADHLVLGSSRLATSMRISPVVVGVVVIGLGTSAPEFLVSGLAAARGDSGLAVGNLIGSNILNLTLILGIAAIVAPLAVDSTVVRREAPLAVGAVLLLALLTWRGLDLWGGLVLIGALAVALYLLIRWALRGDETRLSAEVEEFTQAAHRRGWEGLRAVAGLAGVLIGAQLLVINASAAATRAGVSQVVIGFTIVALGTSLPELVTTITAQRRGESDLVVGNLFGSNLFNSLAGGAIVGVASGDTPAKAEWVLLLAMATTSVLAWVLLRHKLRLTRAHAMILLLAYAMTLPLLLT